MLQIRRRKLPSLVSMKIRIPIPNRSFLSIQLDVVSADVPLLLGVDVLDREILVANNVTNELQSPLLGWSVPLERKFGHLYFCSSTKGVLFTKRELFKVHDISITPQVENFVNWSSAQSRTKLMSLLESYSKKFHDHV